jgi:hypothetical protein
MLHMAGLVETHGGKQHRMMFVNLEGREYWVILTAAGSFYDPPPLVVFEREDGFLEVPSADSIYSSLSELACRHGCVLGDFVSVEPTN